jgi:transposase
MTNYTKRKTIKAIGIDLAKSIFHLHGVDGEGNVVLRKRLSRSKLAEFMAQLTPCLVAIEACGGSHYWARKFQTMGHDVCLISPQFVKLIPTP